RLMTCRIDLPIDADTCGFHDSADRGLLVLADSASLNEHDPPHGTIPGPIGLRGSFYVAGRLGEGAVAQARLPLLPLAICRSVASTNPLPLMSAQRFTGLPGRVKLA